MYFQVNGAANQVNPTLANRNSGESLIINNNYEASGGDRTRDIPIGTSQKGN